MAQFDLRDYRDVQERITEFWVKNPSGRIETNLMSPPDDFTQCRYVARIFKEITDAVPAATGWAFELAGGSGANRTSHEENCETSAIGRALANMGYETSGKTRASKQEMAKVNGSTADPVIDQAWVKRLWIIAGSRGIKDRPEEGDALHTYIAREFQKDSTKKLTQREARQTADWLNGLPVKADAQEAVIA